MREPMAWIAAGTAIGCWWWTRCEGSAALMILTCGLWLAVRSAGTVSFITAGLGIGLCAGHFQTPVPPSLPHIIGRVQSTMGNTVAVQTEHGRVWLRTGRTTPRPGDFISAQTRQVALRSDFPDAWPSNHRAHLANARHARTDHWISNQPKMLPNTDLSTTRNPGIIHALISGDRSGIDPSTYDLLRNTGTVHLLAISGLHIGIISSIGAVIGWLIGRPLVILGWVYTARLIPRVGAIGLACTYGSLVGWPISTQRALCMVTAVALGSFMGRTVRPWQVLGLAAFAVLIADPSSVASLGFLLSFGAVAALISWTPWLTTWAEDRSPPLLWVIRSMASTVAATLGTLPIASWVFQHLALAAPIANLIAVPLFAVVAVPMCLIGEHFAIEWATNAGDGSISAVLIALKSLDWGVLHPSINWVGAVLLGCTIVMTRWPKWAVLVIAIALVPPYRPASLEVTFPDVGQGGAAMVRFENGETWLIDGGPPGNGLLQWLRRSGVRHLDAIILSHPDADHFGGLVPVIEHLSVGSLWVSRRPKPNEHAFHNLWRDAHQNGVQTGIVGPVFGVNDNEESIVVRLRHGNHSFLFTGDIGHETEQLVAAHVGSTTVVQIPHHGSDRSSSNQFIARTDPEWAVVQSGRGNPYGHPKPSVLKSWGAERTLPTNTLGSTRFYSDGNLLTAEHWDRINGWTTIKKSNP